MKKRQKRLTKDIKDYMVRLGADLVGIADPSSLDGSPDGHPSPFRILPGASSIIVAAKRFPHGAVEVPSSPFDGTVEELEVVYGGVYVTTYMSLNSKLLDMAVDASIFLEILGYKSVPVSPTLGRDETRFVGTISLRKCAEIAGLGEIGPSQLLITPDFGPRVRLTAVITTAPLLIDCSKKDEFCQNCMDCLNKCPVNAIKEKTEEFDRKKCLWSVLGLYKATNGEQPPKEWVESKSISEALRLIPQYAELYPRINYYRNLSQKYMGYPNCLSCYVHCKRGKQSSDQMFS